MENRGLHRQPKAYDAYTDTLKVARCYGFKVFLTKSYFYIDLYVTYEHIPGIFFPVYEFYQL